MINNAARKPRIEKIKEIMLNGLVNFCFMSGFFFCADLASDKAIIDKVIPITHNTKKTIRKATNVLICPSVKGDLLIAS